ncbi:HET-domain-containing protein [Lophiostoma macrostomum CBS 122681]|uniref:HET-domain-containing protein n=1 Tax=Lophiostoma macrostomum CBS 122681 TaxID=1314788 RepID=A0A6A6T5T0_9PLEO|nr:HET-domain-containing protein [Lophiostoma macrostomum CBS 122681]
MALDRDLQRISEMSLTVDERSADNPPLACEVCKTLCEATREILGTEKGEVKGTSSPWYLPGVAELCQSDCHGSFFQSLLDRTRMTASDEFPHYQLDEVCFLTDLNTSSLTLSQRGEWRESPFSRDRRTERYGTVQSEFLIEPDPASSKGELSTGIARARPLREYIDLDVVNFWMWYCMQAHGDTCRLPPANQRPPGFRVSWLIDVEQSCLVPAPENAPYVILSYVWGQVPMLKTLKGNLSEHQKPGAFNTTSKSSMQTPATIKNAIDLTTRLGRLEGRLEGGVKYLWVDSLCIVQDDHHSLEQHIQHMALIYEAAVLTIVAADGPHADLELKGLQDISSPRTLAPVLELDDNLRVKYVLKTPISSSNWAKRGWTFQEGIFSRRRLIFFENSVRWVCRSMTCREEEYNCRHSSHTSAFSMVRGIHFRYPNLKALADLVGQYNRRNFTYPEDVVPAISSTLNALTRAYPAGFVFGIPISFLDCFLLWASKTSGKGRRREASSPDRAQEIAPSWSWAGWEGLDSDIEGNANSAMVTFRGGAHKETLSMLDWSMRKSLDSPAIRIPRQNDWYDFRCRFKGLKDDLPGGWHYHLDEKLKWSTHPEAPEGVYYSYDSVSDTRPEGKSKTDAPALFAPDILLTCMDHDGRDNDDIRFWQPVPIGSEREGQSPRTLERGFSYGRYLCAKTKTAQLYLGQLDSSGFEILNNVNVPIGRLQVDGVKEHGLVTSHLLNPEVDDPKFACEIVAISHNVSLSGRSIPFETGKEPVTEYNVLWIVWEEGVAFRRGIGQVSKQEWDSLELNEVDLVLG